MRVCTELHNTSARGEQMGSCQDGCSAVG